jgi:trimethylamine--corrinoid protein Co-methyltransferase
VLENLGVRCTNPSIVAAFRQFEAEGKVLFYENRIYITGDLVNVCLAGVPGGDTFFIPRNSFLVGGRAAFIYNDVKREGGNHT